MGPSGGLTKDNIGVEMAQLVFAIAESPLEEGVIWAGTNDGFVHVTRDGGENWTNVTDNVPDLPPWGTVSNIHPSKHDAATAYMSVDFHQMNGRDPYVYKTTDYGQTLAVHRVGPSPERLQLRALGPRGPGEAGASLPGHGERHLRFLQRRRELADAPEQSAPRPGPRRRGPGALQRPGHRHLRSRFLDHGRHHALPAAHRRGAGLGRSSLRSPGRLQDAHHRRRPPGTDQRLYQLLPEGSTGRAREHRDPGCPRPDGEHPAGHSRRRHQPDLLEHALSRPRAGEDPDQAPGKSHGGSGETVQGAVGE